MQMQKENLKGEGTKETEEIAKGKDIKVTKAGV